MAKNDDKTVGAEQALPLQEDAGVGVKPVIEVPEEYRDPRLKAASLRPKSDDPNKPVPIAPLPSTTRSVEQVYGKDVETMTMIFPKAVTIVNAQKIKLHFPAGVQEVPMCDADNWYLKANGVLMYDRDTGKGVAL
jgi:hypothetical protein